MDRFRPLRNVINPNTVVPCTCQTQGMRPLRLKYNNVCQLLDINRDCLRKIMESDPSFPKPMKQGNSRQSAVFFDAQEIRDWYQKQKDKYRCKEVEK